MAKIAQEWVVCLYDDWVNAFGDKHEVMCKGVRSKVVNTKVVGSQRFLELEEYPGALWWASGFRPAVLN